MDYLEKLIPLAILGIVAAFLISRVRRVAREQVPTAAAEQTPPPGEQLPTAVPAEPTTVAAESVVVDAIVLGTVEVSVPSPMDPIVNVRRQRKQKRAVVKVIDGPTPIQTVLGLLKEKETLAAALVLREILGPPVSKRGDKEARTKKA